MMQLHHGAFSHMSNKLQKKPASKPKHVRFTVSLSVEAYDAVLQIQRKHLAANGKTISNQQVFDASVRAYAKQQGIKVGE